MNARSQRWRDRRDHFVPNASVIDPAQFAVDVIPCAMAKAFVVKHHYSGSFPASRLSVGLFRDGPGGRADLAGVATFSVPMNNRAIPVHTGLANPLAGAELGRLVILDDVAGNGETWFLARAFRALRREKPAVEAVLSYADPVPRLSAAGDLVKPGHVGMIYQAMSAAYRGRGYGRVQMITADGQPFSERAASKIRNRECGHAYAVDELVRRGAPRPANDNLRAWFDGLAESGFFARRRHPGNHVYTFALTKAAKVAARTVAPSAYPKREDQNV